MREIIFKRYKYVKIYYISRKVIKIVNNIINSYYLFMGYIEFANLIIKKSNLDNINLKNLNSKENKLIKNKLQKFFGNRLIIIDEIHNIKRIK